MTISLTQTTTSSIQQGAERAMKTSNLTLKPLCSCLLLGLLAYLAFLASFSAAETHYHEFVVCFFFHSPCTSFYFKRVKWTWFKIISIFSLTFFVWNEIGSSKASEEAVQNPQHYHSQWSVPRTKFGSQKRRFSCHQSYKCCKIQCHHPLVFIIYINNFES